MAWVSDLGLGTARAVLASRPGDAGASVSAAVAAFKAFLCVLSEVLVVGRGLFAAVWRWMAPVHGEVWERAGRERGAWDEYEKGIGWMPWHQEAMKDVARCENLGGAASEL